MATYLYDESLIRKIKSWTSKTNLHIYGPDDTRTLFETIAGENKDKPIELPLICLRRRGGYTLNVPQKKPLTYDGLTLDATCEKSIQLNAIPITIPYQLDVYTRYYKEADEYMRNIVFNLINYPTLTVNIPYNDIDIQHAGNIKLSSEIIDNSDISERLIVGQFTRLTVEFDIDDAYLFDAKVRDNYSIECDIEAK